MTVLATLAGARARGRRTVVGAQFGRRRRVRAGENGRTLMYSRAQIASEGGTT